MVDIDGVLADVGHRLHFLDQRPKDWKGFFAAARTDPGHPEGLDLVGELRADHDIVLLTGRPEHCRADTEAWLADHDVGYELVVMRPAGNHRPAAEVKIGLLGVLARDRTVAVLVDDDEAVTEAARAAGYPVRLASWGRPAETLRHAQEVEGRT
ncbi:hypothetical protein BH24ACT1_BH24ACT1_04960 [soil metagenome]